MSQQLDLEFIPKTMLSSTSIGSLLILLASFWLAVFTWQTHHQQQVKLTEITNKMNKNKNIISSKAMDKFVVKPTIATISSKQLIQLSDDINVLSTPWNELLDAVEQSDMPNIALLGLEPNVKKQQVLLTGEAKNLTMILQYINKLERQERLSQVYLQKHNMDETKNEKPLSFSIVAKWDNATFGAQK